MSSKFTQKALAHATGQAMTTLLDGREGPELQIIAQRLHSSPYNLSSEEIDDYYDAYCIFPLDSSHHINATSLQIFYENSDITLEYQDAVNALHVFLGQRNLTSIDFEVFVVNMEKWKKKEVHYPEVLKMACTIYDESGPNVQSVKQLLTNIDGPHLSKKSLSLLANAIANCEGEDK